MVKGRPRVYQGGGKMMSFYITNDNREKLKVLALERGLSFSAVLNFILEEYYNYVFKNNIEKGVV